MESKENKLSNYIDSLKWPIIPEGNYSKVLTGNIKRKVINEKDLRIPRKRWFYSAVIAAAALALIVTLNTIGPFKKNNMVYAMEQSYNAVKASGEFKPTSMTVLGKINNSAGKVQSPVQTEAGVLQGGGTYAGITGISSVRWQEDGIEYAVLGNTSLFELTSFVKSITNEVVDLSLANQQTSDKPKVEVPVDLAAEKGDQKNADAGHSPWKLDPVFVSQVFVSLKISPQGIVGDYPIKYEDLKVVKNNGKEAVVEVSGSKTPIRRVYLKRLIRQDNTGIWTVVGYDPADNK